MEKVTESNKLIAEFMGLPTTKTEIEFSGNRNEKIVDRSFNYHENWGSLLLVTEQIGKIIKNDARAFLHLIIWSEILWNSRLIDLKIEKVYEAVLVFITWYNSTLTPNPPHDGKSK